MTEKLPEIVAIKIELGLYVVFMDVVHVAAEFAPLAKVGGLGDVIFGLGRALCALDHSVEVVLPKYDVLDLKCVENLQVIGHDLPNQITLWQGQLDSLTLTLIESHDERKFFSRGRLYGCEDDAERFIHFCQSVASYINHRETAPDVVHVHDWHTALVAGLTAFPTLLTIHNLAYQGECSAALLKKCGVKEKSFKEGNLLKGGLLSADWVTTVSPNYAQEILRDKNPLQPTLEKIKDHFSGILNGIDTTYWNPKFDRELTYKFDLKTLEEKEKEKNLLREKLGLEISEAPLVAAITRLVPQKGPELIKAALLQTIDEGGQFVLLGAASDDATHATFHDLKERFADNPNCHIELEFNEPLAHKLYGASDLFLVPSLFEPCGLTQMIAMRYGSVPLVRNTGGLADTVHEEENGFVFEEFSVEAIQGCLAHALATWKKKPNIWKQLMTNGMSADHSWETSAQAYATLYAQITPES